MKIEDLNGRTRERFVEALGWIFEGAPWVAERAWAHGPFASLDGLHAAMVAEVEHASREEKLALLRAHPDLGVRALMSDASMKEQSGAGTVCLQCCSSRPRSGGRPRCARLNFDS